MLLDELKLLKYKKFMAFLASIDCFWTSLQADVNDQD